MHRCPRVVGWLVGQAVGLGGAGKTDGRVAGWVGWVGALPRAQGWCGRALGSSGTWLALEFYCEPARAWHSHENGYGRTEGRKERVKEWRGRAEAAEERSRCKEGGGEGWWGRGGGRWWMGEGQQQQQQHILFWWFLIVCRGNDFKGGLVAGLDWQGKKDERQKNNNKGQKKSFTVKDAVACDKQQQQQPEQDGDNSSTVRKANS